MTAMTQQYRHTTGRRDVAIVANPAAGRMRREKARDRLSSIARDLKAPVLGLDSGSASDFRNCVSDVSREFDVLLVAGGDGTFTDAINSQQGGASLGYLPFGTGNALAAVLGLGGNWDSYLERVRRKAGTPVGVMLVNGQYKAFFASLGIDALTVQKYNEMGGFPGNGLGRYAVAFAKALGQYRASGVEIRGQQGVQRVSRSLTAIISKHPFYGYGLRVNRGDLTDPYLHARVFNQPRLMTLKALAGAALGHTPRSGVFHKDRQFSIVCDREQALQCDGEWCGSGREFRFELLPDHLKLIM